MYSFKDDYSEGAHPNILKALMQTNTEQENGYGLDRHCENAKTLIRAALDHYTADIHFLVGGTQTNLIAISAFLRPHEACIAVDSGHIAVHETGAIENTGHKVITRPSNDGKMTIKIIENVLKEHVDEHMVKPKLVYISNSTELGTVYTKAELELLYQYCSTHQLLLYLDGARLGSALAVESSGLALKDIAALTDAFYIGGTKNGAFLGEALVITNPSLKEDFRYQIKQKGALLAKGRVIGIQFEELFKDHLLIQLATHANQMANLLAEGIKASGYSLYCESPTNQVFPIFPNDLIQRLYKNYDFYVFEEIDENNSMVRLVTSWATSKETILQFLNDLK